VNAVNGVPGARALPNVVVVTHREPVQFELILLVVEILVPIPLRVNHVIQAVVQRIVSLVTGHHGDRAQRTVVAALSHEHVK
jgi:hypothetical protein